MSGGAYGFSFQGICELSIRERLACRRRNSLIRQPSERRESLMPGKLPYLKASTMLTLNSFTTVLKKSTAFTKRIELESVDEVYYD